MSDASPIDPTDATGAADAVDSTDAASDAVAGAFEQQRDRLRAVAYRMPGSYADAAKMIASRARKKVRDGRTPTPAAREQRVVVDAFLAAARQGDFEGLLRVLDPEVRLSVDTADGPVVVLGATEVATGARIAAGGAVRGVAALVDGLPGFAAFGADGKPISVMAFTVVNGRITRMQGVTDPARLASVHLLARPARTRVTSSSREH
jgi:hypothetical protein